MDDTDQKRNRASLVVRSVLLLILAFAVISTGALFLADQVRVYDDRPSPRTEWVFVVVDENGTPIEGARITALDQGLAAPQLIDELRAGAIKTDIDGRATCHRMPVRVQDSVSAYQYLEAELRSGYASSRQMENWYEVRVSASGFFDATFADMCLAFGSGVPGVKFLPRKRHRFSDGVTEEIEVFEIPVTLKRVP